MASLGRVAVMRLHRRLWIQACFLCWALSRRLQTGPHTVVQVVPACRPSSAQPAKHRFEEDPPSFFVRPISASLPAREAENDPGSDYQFARMPIEQNAEY